MRRLACALALCVAGSAIAIEPGERLPDLTLPALHDPSPVTLASFRGNVTYVDFWASWCIPCRESMPLLDTLYKRHRAAGFAVVGINKDVTAADAERFLKRVAVSFPLVNDARDAAARAFDVKAMPSGYLVDRKGVVRHVHRGFTAETASALEREIEALLKERS
jgi:thiol-disulfide isomerase/thioredoxin